MNILALIPDLREPSGRFRILQFVSPLARHGIGLHAVELSRSERKRWKQLGSARDYDAVILHRKLLNWLEFRKLRKYSRRLIYDFDDAVMFRDSNAARPDSLSRRRRFRRIVSGSDLVLAGNKYLAEECRRYHNRTFIIPTVVDLALYPERSRAGKGETIGWIGTRSNFIYLDIVAEALRDLRRIRPAFQFKVVSNNRWEIAGVPVVNKMWALSEEVSDLLSFSVGIMPLRDDPWSRGKCAFKIIQYFSAFLPVVCSPVGANLEVVQEGGNGFFASTTAEWVSKLSLLLHSPEKRMEMGKEGRRLVEEKYSLQAIIPKLVAVLEGTGTGSASSEGPAGRARASEALLRGSAHKI